MNIQNAIDKTNNLQSKIDRETMKQLVGLSTPKVRHLLNNLASESSSYLEIGCYLGGTLRAALHGNDHLYAVAIDNFSMSPGKRDEFFKNTEMLKFQFIEEDAFKVKLSLIYQPIDCYFYDGAHSFEATQQALKYYYPVLADEFTFIVDDWNMKRIPNATFSAARELNLEVMEVFNLNCVPNGEWWNGIGIVRLKKNL